MPKISEEKRQARRLEILDVAGRCFARQGFHRTSMADIIRELKSSPGAVYCYFRGKTDIVEAIAEQRHKRESMLLAELLASGKERKEYAASCCVKLAHDIPQAKKGLHGEFLSFSPAINTGLFHAVSRD